jgi:hypothetical protein
VTQKNPAVAGSSAGLLEGRDDFSLVLGGPLFQLLRRAHLAGTGAELLTRRMFASVLITWLPLFVLAMFAPTAEGASRLPFLQT